MPFTDALPPGVAGRIRTKRSIFFDEWAEMLPMLAALFLFAVAHYLLECGRPTEWRKNLGVCCLWGFAGLVVTGILVHRINRNFLANAILWRLARRQVSRRPNRIVDPDDSGAWFVAEFPRRRWEHPTLRRAADVGLLKIDRERGMLLFEGDKARYRIPAQAISKCGREQSREYDEEVGFSDALIRRWLRYFFVSIEARDGDRNCEASFRILAGKSVFTTKQQDLASNALAKEIQEMQLAFR